MDMEPLCRACLASAKTLTCFDDSCINYYNLLTNLLVEINDGLPQNLCSDCWSTIQAFITFREKCITTENTLKMKMVNSLHFDVDLPFIDFNIKKEELSDTRSNFDDDNNFEHYSDIQPTLNSDENETPIDENISITIKTRARRKIMQPKYFESETIKHEKKRTVKGTKPNEENIKKENKTNTLNKLSQIKKFNCGLCKEVFKLRERLINHLNSHKSNLVCLICKDDFISWQALIAHRFNHIDNDEKYCHMCNQKFTFEGSMMHHYLYCHMAEGDNKLDNHISGQHSGKTYICDHCGATFPTKNQILSHILNVHNTSPQFKCDVCNNKYKTSFIMMNHKLRVHGGDGGKKFYCSKCSRYFQSEDKKNNHSCAGLKTVMCQVCGRTMKKKCYNKHMRSHSNQRFECPLCPTKLISGQAFKAHMNKHEGKPSYKCPYCAKEFYSATNLLTHKRIHTGEKPYVCQFCGKGFPKNHNLKVHMKVHGLHLVQKKNAVDETKDIMKSVS